MNSVEHWAVFSLFNIKLATGQGHTYVFKFKKDLGRRIWLRFASREGILFYD